MKLILCALLALYCFIFVTASPEFWDDDFDFNFTLPNIVAECRRLGCPNNVASCSRSNNTSIDNKFIQTNTVCTDKSGHVVRNDTTSRPNPNPGSVVQAEESFGGYSEGNLVETFYKK